MHFVCVERYIGASVEPSLVVVGVSYRTAALAVRERFWMDERQHLDALDRLVRSEGVDEVFVLSTCNRTEFYVWTQSPSDAANSVLRFLTREYNLKLSEWKNFYRIVDDAAITHLFRVAAGLDTRVFIDPDITAMIRNAWSLARQANTIGRFLDHLLKRALDVAQRVYRDSGEASHIVAVPEAALRQIRDVLPASAKYSILVLGAGKMSNQFISALKRAGMPRITVLSHNSEHARHLATDWQVRWRPMDEMSKQLSESDVVVAATSSREYLLTSSNLDPIVRARQNGPLVIVDTGVPRNVEPQVRSLPRVSLYDIDDLCENTPQCAIANHGMLQAEKVASEQAVAIRKELLSESVVPALAALRQRLESICDLELKNLAEQYGPFTQDQSDALEAYAGHISERLSAMLARQLSPTHSESDVELTGTLEHLFAMQTRRPAIRD